ncbi:hypothetical protein ACWOFR_01135 [Carnobacterium gallinarum]|uniref:hypothetical protein n=1 Tax=Carnobacterium gallinarum TaxID=2749 RepID=UPI00054F2223|nr:hypothetical protein [Carnobacterium gallinarum]
MEYVYKNVELWGKTLLTINFTDDSNIGLGNLLNLYGDSITLDDILIKIELVLSGQSDLEEIGNERSFAEIKKENTEISDLFEGLIDDDSLNPTIIIPTEKFKDIIVDFKAEIAKKQG